MRSFPLQSRAMRPLRALLVLCLVATSWPVAACAQEDEVTDERDAQYRALIRDAVEQSRDGRLQEALALFLRAHEIRPSARTLRGIGLVRFGLQDYAGTIRALSASLTDERRPLDDDDHAEAEQILARARSFVAQVQLSLSPEDMRVSSDGLAIEREPDGSVLLNPGSHELRFEAEGHQVDTRQLTVEGGATPTLEVTLEPTGAEAMPRPQPPRSQHRVRVRSETEGLILHAFPMSGPGELVPNAVSQVCAAPCEGQLSPGLYRLAVGHGTDEPIVAEDYRVDDALDVTLHFEDRNEQRVIGWVVGSTLVATGLVVLATVAAISGETGQVVIGLISGGLMATGVSIGVPLIAWNDGAAVEVTVLPDDGPGDDS